MTDDDATDTWPELIEEWIDRSGVSAIVVAAISDGSGATILDTWEPSPKKKQAKPKARELSARFISGARSHCEAMGRPFRYSCAIMRGGGVVAQRFKELRPISEPSLGGDAAGATDLPGGFFKPALRHIERMTQLHEVSARAMLANLASMVERQHKELAQYRATDLDRLELIQNLLDRKASRSLAERKAIKDEKRFDAGWEQLAHVVKLVAARLSGADAASVLLRQIPEEALGPLMDKLDDDGRAAMRQILEQGVEAEHARRGLLKIAPAGAPAEITEGASSPNLKVTG